MTIEAKSTEQKDLNPNPNPNPKQPPAQMTQETLAILMNELHAFGRDVRDLINRSEDRLAVLSKKARENLAADLATAPAIIKQRPLDPLGLEDAATAAVTNASPK
jgi:hypothetical protein